MDRTDTSDESLTASLHDIGRRGYLGAAAGAAALVSSSGVVGASGREWEEIVVPAGETPLYWITDEVWEHKLIDITAEGAGVFIIGHDDAVIRNIGIKGEQPSDWEYGNSWMVVEASEGSTVRVERVYMADGLEDDHGGGGIFVHRNHAGHCVIDNVHVARSGDNGIYASSPGQETAGHGTVEIRNTLSHNSTVSQFRIGSAGSRIVNCVGYVDEPTPEYRVPGGSRFSRGIWHWYQRDCEVRDTHIDMAPDPVHGADTDADIRSAVRAGRGGGHLRVAESEIRGVMRPDFRGSSWEPPHEFGAGFLSTDNVGNDPTHAPPRGVPMTAEAAAKGNGSPG